MAEVKVFVGRLPRDITDEDFEALMASQAGLVQTVLLKDRATGKGKGCGFVMFSTMAEAVACVEALNGAVTVSERLGPLQVSVATGEAEKHGVPQEAVDPGEAKLFVGGLPKGEDRSVVAAEVEAIFSGYGKVREVFIMKDKANKCNGAGFVFMPTASAMTAIEALHEQHIMAGGTSAIEVRFAVARRDQQPTPEEYPAYPAYAKGAGKGGIKGGAKGAYMGGMPPMAPMRFPAPAMHMMQQRAAKGGGRAPPPPPDDGLRAIAGWTEFLGGNGRPYYYHAATGLTQWQQPIEFKSLPALGMGTPFATKGGKKGGRARPY
mmetsp:Transcript_51393/g.112633  ORF Transcript_51393/g.112633 Transcript_51393/m.112633 type:complete len:320 (-) Transcript_51393:895-1854(-)